MKVFQALKLVDGIKLGETLNLSSDKYYYFSEPKSKDDSDTNTNHIHLPTNKAMEGIEELCKTCIKNKHTKIIKIKKMTLTTRRF